MIQAMILLIRYDLLTRRMANEHDAGKGSGRRAKGAGRGRVQGEGAGRGAGCLILK